jgi:hypothetical protein
MNLRVFALWSYYNNTEQVPASESNPRSPSYRNARRAVVENRTAESYSSYTRYYYIWVRLHLLNVLNEKLQHEVAVMELNF